ncbi:Uu.00g051020.m01.CDS01 [Anthostomella pinea]|uniref:Uu.00g051020.m01.CDS01 n=1 Tax=Anthostomella pinea TaxID=933095 RepID=A0AAI8YMQ9_9PEZI|nr:Uu.00g051020.m01.CDS01 [Anthostomella pinea]
MKHDVIVGKKFFNRHDVLVDSPQQRLLFPDEWIPDYRALPEISMDSAGSLLKDVAYDQDAVRRDKLMETDDKQRRASQRNSRRSDIKTQKQVRDDQRTMTLFKPVTSVSYVHVCDIPIAAVRHDQPLDGHSIQATEIFVLDDADPPEFSGIALNDELLHANKEDASLAKYRKKEGDGSSIDWTMSGELVLFCGRLAVPNSNNLYTRVVAKAHSSLATAHPGINKTRQMVSKRYWWPNLNGFVIQYIENCTCKPFKNPRDKTPGLLMPLPVPEGTWQDLTIDFKTMPKDKDGYDNLFVVIDRLSKIPWSTPYFDTATAQDAAWMVYNGPYHVLGWPQTFTSDRGPQFISAFTDELSKIHGTKLEFSSAGHKQSVGQVEIMNKYIDQRLQPFVNHFQDNWARAIPAMDAAQVSLPHESLGGLSPREVLTGRPMKMSFDWEARTKVLAKLPKQERLTRSEAQEMARQIQTWAAYARGAIKKAQDRMVQ